MKPIRYGTFYNGQSGLGKLDQARFYDTDNLDIHTETGMAMPRPALESESTTPNEACWNIYKFSRRFWFFNTKY